jgi:hypothetical protein
MADSHYPVTVEIKDSEGATYIATKDGPDAEWHIQHPGGDRFLYGTKAEAEKLLKWYVNEREYELRFEVRTLIGGMWENVWTVGRNTPMTFETWEEAEAELKDHRESLKEADMDDDDEYRIQQASKEKRQ